MDILATSDGLLRIWEQLNAPHLAGRSDGRRTAHQDIVRDGWGMSCDVQDLLWETDDRADMLARHYDEFKFLLATYKLNFISRFRQPGARDEDAIGHTAMRAADIAMYVMEIERLGFTVDAEPLVAALRPSLIKQKYLTNSELSVVWYKKQRHRCDPLMLRIAENRQPTTWKTIITHSGYHVTATLDHDRPVSLRVDAPKSKSRKDFPLKLWVDCEISLARHREMNGY